jgi:hypothetical protein
VIAPHGPRLDAMRSASPAATKSFVLPARIRRELLQNACRYSSELGTVVVDVLRCQLGRVRLTTVRNVGYCRVGT